MRIIYLAFFSSYVASWILALPCSAQESLKKEDLSAPYVAWADGQEVEIRFRLDKIKAAGLTLKDLESVKYMRFLGKNWKRKVNKVEVDVKEVAELKFRALHAPPFTVKLLDGREATITPNAKKVGMYMVTGEYFQHDVIGSLDNPFVADPAETVVVGGIVVFGDLPHSTGPDKVHRSLGEPLKEFACVEYRGKPGPQAAELSRMRVAYSTVLEAMGSSRGTSRELIEKRFGPGKPSDPKMPDGPRIYLLASGRLEVHWKDNGKSVDYVYALHGKEHPTAKADEPHKLATQARELADAERAIVLEYFSKMRDTLTLAEKSWVRDLLARSQTELRWTKYERRMMLGKEH